MFETQINKLFESDAPTGYLTLKKQDLDDKTLMDLFRIKPSEINILISRVVAFLKNDGKDKSRKDIVNDILEVLERSSVARKIVGIGLQQEYKIYRGFPVRKGDAYETMPSIGSDLQLKPTEVFLSWSTDSSKTREESTKYDPAKGEPIGGLVVEAHVDPSKLLFDVNAVINAVKSKINVINQYNLSAAPGKSLSKSNTAYLASEAPLYRGEYEILTTNRVVQTKVLDKWLWDNANGNKTVKWVGSETPKETEVVKPPQTNGLGAEKDASAAPIQQNVQSQQNHQGQQVRESIRHLFEDIEGPDDVLMDFSKNNIPLCIDESFMSEAAIDNLRKAANWFHKTLGISSRGKTLSYLNLMVKNFEARKQVYVLAKEYAEMLNDQDPKIEHAQKQIDLLDELIADAKDTLEYYENNTKEDLRFSKKGELIKPKKKQKVVSQPAPVKNTTSVSTPAVAPTPVIPPRKNISILEESFVGILDNIVNTKFTNKTRLTKSKVEKAFKKLVNAIEHSYNLRLELLNKQRNILEDQLKGFRGTKFAQLKEVSEIEDLFNETNDTIEYLKNVIDNFNHTKNDAITFDFADEVELKKQGKNQEEEQQKALDALNASLEKEPGMTAEIKTLDAISPTPIITDSGDEESDSDLTTKLPDEPEVSTSDEEIPPPIDAPVDPSIDNTDSLETAPEVNPSSEPVVSEPENIPEPEIETPPVLPSEVPDTPIAPEPEVVPPSATVEPEPIKPEEPVTTPVEVKKSDDKLQALYDINKENPTFRDLIKDISNYNRILTGPTFNTKEKELTILKNKIKYNKFAKDIPESDYIKLLNIARPKTSVASVAAPVTPIVPEVKPVEEPVVSSTPSIPEEDEPLTPEEEKQLSKGWMVVGKGSKTDSLEFLASHPSMKAVKIGKTWKVMKDSEPNKPEDEVIRYEKPKFPSSSIEEILANPEYDTKIKSTDMEGLISNMSILDNLKKELTNTKRESRKSELKNDIKIKENNINILKNKLAIPSDKLNLAIDARKQYDQQQATQTEPEVTPEEA